MVNYSQMPLGPYVSGKDRKQDGLGAVGAHSDLVLYNGSDWTEIYCEGYL